MRLGSALSIFVALVMPLSGQSFTPRTIGFEGAPQYPAADLAAATGLQPGKPYTQADVDAATQRLGDLGLFADVTWKTIGPALQFTLQPAPAAEMRQVGFGNFVMFSAEELTQKLHARVPLFLGTVPVAGMLAKSVGQALQVILKQAGIDATVSSIGNKEGALVFTIASPPVVVTSLAIPGADFDGTPRLAAVRNRVVGLEYIEGTSGSTLRESLLDAYQNLGLLDAEVSPLTHGAPTISAQKIGVPLVGTATPGPLYRVAGLALPPVAPGVPPDEVTAAAQIKVGDPAAKIEVMSTNVRVNSTFAGHGYLDARTSYEATKNSAAHTMAYAFSTRPGAQYHFHALHTNNMSPQQAGVVTANWKLAAGAPMERAAVGQFLHQGVGATLCGGAAAEATQVPDRDAHQVDVIIACVAPR